MRATFARSCASARQARRQRSQGHRRTPDASFDHLVGAGEERGGIVRWSVMMWSLQA